MQQEEFKKYLLSKSDFKIARTCPAKLYYKKLKYPTSNDENEYMQYLAKGGYMVGKLATLMYPEGISIETGNDHQMAVKLTDEYLAKNNITLFEAAILINGKIIRIDILEKKGNVFNLIEVKSKSFNSDEDVLKQKKMMQEYIEDVAFQYLVLKEKFPGAEIKPFLLLPDKAKTTSIEGYHNYIRISEPTVYENSTFRTFEVTVDESKLEEIKKDDILTLINLEQDVEQMFEGIRKAANEFVTSLQNGLTKIEVPISKTCFGCEFNRTDETHALSAYDECWINMPKHEHQISELYHIGTLGSNQLANKLIEQKKTSLFEIPNDSFTKIRGIRQTIQVQNTKSNTEWFSKDIAKKLSSLEYPLHFIDFETSISALPFHKGMRPYEMVAFQWSCHTIKNKGAEPVHAEWINMESDFPSFKFAESLMNHVGYAGTFLMWATHENTTLRNILEQTKKYAYSNPELLRWLNAVVKKDSDDFGIFFDLNKFTLENYFHPEMRGRTSIKVTLPAVLKAFSSPRIEKWLREFEKEISLFGKDESGDVINPYLLLPPLSIYKDVKIKDGTGAMLAYDEMLFGVHKGDEELMKEFKTALLRYCKIDTLAMVIIWEHWSKAVRNISGDK